MNPCRSAAHFGNPWACLISRLPHHEECSRRDEVGFTLIEVAVALALLAVVLLPLASVFYGAQSANADNREYGDAIAIANGQLAQASGVTYANLGLYEHPSGTNCNVPVTIPGYNGQPAVDLGACPPTGTSAQIQPTSTPQQVGSVIYTATNYVVWVNGSGGDSCAYKQVYSVVSWNEGGNTAHAAQFILVYPGGLGKYTGSQCLNFIVSTTGGSTAALVASGGFPGVAVGMGVSGPNIAPGTTVVAISGNNLTLSVAASGTGTQTLDFGSTPQAPDTTPDNVAGLAVTVPADPAGETQLNLTWTAPVDTPGYFVAVWAPDPGGQSHLAAPDTTGTSSAWAPTGSSTSGSILATATSDTVTGLAPSTTYWFEIVAFSAGGDQWAISQSWVGATTLAPPAQPCTLNTLTVSQAGQSSGQATVAKSSGELIQPITMTVTYSGTCTAGSDVVTVSATSSGADPGSPYTFTWAANQYTYNPPTGLCPVGTGFITGTHTYTVLHNGTATSLTAQVSFSQDKKSTPAC
jgi:prepilin-type N-terminal cleavage/methylation domain-containing protein